MGDGEIELADRVRITSALNSGKECLIAIKNSYDNVISYVSVTHQ